MALFPCPRKQADQRCSSWVYFYSYHAYAEQGELDGQLQLAIDIFTNQYKPFSCTSLFQSIDVDRMDYLTRDSFLPVYRKVWIGMIVSSKCLSHNGELMAEEKGIYSIEKFLVSRRLMYWQVYLHKTVLVQKTHCKDHWTCQRAHCIGWKLAASPVLDLSLQQHVLQNSTWTNSVWLMVWMWWQPSKTVFHSDVILSTRAVAWYNAVYWKLNHMAEPLIRSGCRNSGTESAQLNISSWLPLFQFSGEAVNTTYDPMKSAH